MTKSNILPPGKSNVTVALDITDHDLSFELNQDNWAEFRFEGFEGKVYLDWDLAKQMPTIEVHLSDGGVSETFLFETRKRTMTVRVHDE